MRLLKKVVDERQELELMRNERIGFWVMLWGLLIVIHVELFFNGFNFKLVAGEIFILAIGALIVTVGHLRKGLWSYYTNPSLKSNIRYSLGGALVLSVISSVLRYKKLLGMQEYTIGKLFTFFVMQMVIIFGACFIISTLMSFVTNKRKNNLEEEFDDKNSK